MRDRTPTVQAARDHDAHEGPMACQCRAAIIDSSASVGSHKAAAVRTFTAFTTRSRRPACLAANTPRHHTHGMSAVPAGPGRSPWVERWRPKPSVMKESQPTGGPSYPPAHGTCEIVWRPSLQGQLASAISGTLRLKRNSLSPIFSVGIWMRIALCRLLSPSCSCKTFLVGLGV